MKLYQVQDLAMQEVDCVSERRMIKHEQQYVQIRILPRHASAVLSWKSAGCTIKTTLDVGFRCWIRLW